MCVRPNPFRTGSRVSKRVLGLQPSTHQRSRRATSTSNQKLVAIVRLTTVSRTCQKKHTRGPGRIGLSCAKCYISARAVSSARKRTTLKMKKPSTKKTASRFEIQPVVGRIGDAFALLGFAERLLVGWGGTTMPLTRLRFGPRDARRAGLAAATACRTAAP